ncbi:MAG: hypothetical protein JXA90_09365 [Planctomycetes bacterium]|nr:hypothetical protein [Planctomycetota bacterium]
MTAIRTERGLQGIAVALTAAAAVIGVSCRRQPAAPSAAGADSKVTELGSIEVTARLVEIPEGAIFKREMYDYATVLKYQVLEVHRGDVSEETIYIGHYNPFKPRSEAADRRVEGIGGNLEVFRAGQMHRMALEVPIDDYFMGGIVNKYFGRFEGPIYWAVWTDEAGE